MVLTIGRSEVECESFRVRGAYSATIARLFALPVAVASKEPLTLEVTIKGNKFKPYKSSRRVFWNKKHVGFFVLSNVIQEWDGSKYRTKLELKQSERLEVPDGEIPAYKWRHDLRALAENLPETEGAKLEAGRIIDPFANSWKLGTDEVAESSPDDVTSPAVLPVSRGGTGASDPAIALTNLGGISSASKGIPFGVAPLGADGKVPVAYLPPSSGGGGSSVVFPITVAQGGTGALDAATARTNLGAISAADLASGLSTKADASAVSSALSLKADASAVSSALALKADASAVSSALALKLDTSTYNTGIALKLDTSTYNTGIALKLDTSTYNTGIALKLDTSVYNAGIALKLDASTRNAANGVAGLDANSLILAAQIPSSVQFSLQPRTSSTPFNFDTFDINHAGIKWVDSNAGHTGIPAGQTSGALIHYDPLDNVSGATNLYRLQAFFNYGNRVWDRYQSNGTWSSWNERAYLNRAQTFTGLQEFNGGLFATNTAVKNDVQTTGLYRNGVNFSAPVQTTNQRQARVNYASNGNIQIQVLSDDSATVLYQWEFTASGNMLVPGVMRFAGYTSNPSGATFVPGAIYYHSTLKRLVYSDGTNWYQLTIGAQVT